MEFTVRSCLSGGGGYPLGKDVLLDAHSYFTGREGPYPI